MNELSNANGLTQWTLEPHQKRSCKLEKRTSQVVIYDLQEWRLARWVYPIKYDTIGKEDQHK